MPLLYSDNYVTIERFMHLQIGIYELGGSSVYASKVAVSSGALCKDQAIFNKQYSLRTICTVECDLFLFYNHGSRVLDSLFRFLMM